MVLIGNDAYCYFSSKPYGFGMAFHGRELRCFLAVVDTGSLGRAANLINASQPALSRLISELEKRLGQVLFDRHTRGMTLTAAGSALVPHARLLLHEMEQAIDTLDAMRGLKRGTARIGAVATIARSVLAGAVDRLLAGSPGLQVELLEAADDRLITALTRREVDVIIAGDLSPQEEIIAVAECRFDDSYLVFCAAGHPLAAGPEPTLADVLSERWVMPARGATPRELFEAAILQAGGSRPDVAVETWSPSAMIAFVERTRFLSWLPRPLFSSAEAAGTVRCLAIPELMMSRRFFAYRRRRGSLPAPASRLLEELPLVSTW